VKRIASTNLEVAWQFARRAPALIGPHGSPPDGGLGGGACDTYDVKGLRPALQVLEEADHYAERKLEMTAGVLFEDVAVVLGNFVRGLSGRRLRVEQGDSLHTDTETILLPGVIAPAFPVVRITSSWSRRRWPCSGRRTRFGTFPRRPWRRLRRFSRPATRPAAAARPGDRAPVRLHRARIAGAAPRHGTSQGATGRRAAQGGRASAKRLAEPEADLDDSLALLGDAMHLPDFTPWCYQGELKPAAVAAAFAARQEKEKARLRVKLAELLEKHSRHQADQPPGEERADAGIRG